MGKNEYVIKHGVVTLMRDCMISHVELESLAKELNKVVHRNKYVVEFDFCKSIERNAKKLDMRYYLRDLRFSSKGVIDD
ncbi:hypothetical protein KIN20_033155 [Parelaphostrongylus tenuis]|uniref:Uncharacterized protein n=1 Tax=Parelaphostrongylus tenuis TaxID=148309 RepID=A0AAD5WJ02_PARTN|nr:hypothetical protein KIN20_033155 [Parelaphostrongylus tenuis]